VIFITIFGKLKLLSPYLWVNAKSSKPLKEEMGITHQGRSEAVKRALSDFGIEDSFSLAAKRFKEHYHFDIGVSAVARSTKQTAMQAMHYVEKKTSDSDGEKAPLDKMLVELDGCEIRTAVLQESENTTGTTPVYGKPKRTKRVNWRDVRIGFVRPLDGTPKIFVGKMDSYPEVVEQLYGAAQYIGMTSKTEIVGVCDGGIGLPEALQRQFPTMQFVLDKSHLQDHFYDTAEKMAVPKKDQKKWVSTRVEAIAGGDVEKVLIELKEEYERSQNKRTKRLIGYINRFYDALDYDTFKSKGYPIGSGEIESAHKSIPQKRLKIPGASWHPDSIDPMLSLRILRANDWWEEFWDQRTEKLLAA